MLPDSPARPPDLQYPPVKVNRSFTQVDLDTLIMRSTTRRSTAEAGSALDDSSYDMLTDSVLDMSDDDGHTESLASTEDPTPDQGSEFSDDDEDDFIMGERGLQGSIDLSRPTAEDEHNEDRFGPGTGDSVLTETSSHIQSSGALGRIRFDEQLEGEEGILIGSKVINTFPNNRGELFPVLQRYQSSQVRFVVKAALSEQPLPTPDSYRILYVGQVPEWTETDITRTLWKALNASPGPSRSFMIQGQLEPYGPIMNAFHCTHLEFIVKDGAPPLVKVALDNGTEFTFGPGQTVPLDIRPDLVVFFRTNGASTEEHQRTASAYQLLFQGDIPCIQIADIMPYGAGNPSYDGRSLMVHIEGRSDSEVGYKLREVLPLDLNKLLDLEPSVLNRHLAFISPHLASSMVDNQIRASSMPWSSRFSRLTKGSKFWRPINLKVLLPACVIAIWAISYMLLGTWLASVPAGVSNLTNQSSNHLSQSRSITNQASIRIPSFTRSSLSSRSSSISASTPSAPPSRRDVSLSPRQLEPQKQQTYRIKSTNSKVKFHIKTNGTRRFVLQPCKALAGSRKKPHLQIEVTKDSLPVAFRYNRTINGEYIVDLEREYSYTSFNVSVATLSKPHLEQTFEIPLGRNRSIAERIIFDAYARVSSLQGFEFHLFNLSATSVLNCLPEFTQTRSNYSQLLAYLQETRQETTDRVEEAKSKIIPGVRACGKLIKNFQYTSWTRVRNVTAPVRTSQAILLARQNALRLRCKMETAAGLSSQKVDGKQSWACSKIQYSPEA